MDDFRYAQDKVWQEAWNSRMKEFQSEFPTTWPESIDRIAEDPELVLYDNYFTIRTYEKYQKCLIVDIPTPYDQKVLSYAFQKNSPYLDLFNYHLKVL